MDNEELIDLIADAIDDSLDMDWASTDGSKSVLRRLGREGYAIVEKEKMTDTVTATLLPCPFCGGDANPNGTCHYGDGHEAWWPDGTQIRKSFFVNCTKCRISNKGLLGHQTRQSAIAAWNTRELESTQADEIKQLRAVLQSVVDRSNNDPIGTSKVQDIRRICIGALENE